MKCKVCGVRLEVKPIGRKPKYCSAACRQQAYRERKKRRAERLFGPGDVQGDYPDSLTSKLLVTANALAGKLDMAPEDALRELKDGLAHHAENFDDRIEEFEGFDLVQHRLREERNNGPLIQAAREACDLAGVEFPTEWMEVNHG